ncbi:RNA-binding protein EWS [Terramyces sp. JEL0728]|nr:RNA-binding protein EWS [Terramyces sp. JEL0728]
MEREREFDRRKDSRYERPDRHDRNYDRDRDRHDRRDYDDRRYGDIDQKADRRYDSGDHRDSRDGRVERRDRDTGNARDYDSRDYRDGRRDQRDSKDSRDARDSKDYRDGRDRNSHDYKDNTNKPFVDKFSTPAHDPSSGTTLLIQINLQTQFTFLVYHNQLQNNHFVNILVQLESLKYIDFNKIDKRTNAPRVWVYKDKQTGKAKGDATVTYSDPSASDGAINWFDGSCLFNIRETL